MMQKTVLAHILKRAGKLPHARLEGKQTDRKKQSTRLLKAECPKCGYAVRRKKWLAEAGAPYCGVRGHGRMICEDFEDEGEGEE